MEMSENEPDIDFFHNNLREIFSKESNQLVKFVLEVNSVELLNKAFKDWPKEIKLRVVRRFRKEEEFQEN